MTRSFITLALICSTLLISSCTQEKVYYAKDFGILPNTQEDYSLAFCDAFTQIANERNGKAARLVLETGDYNFYPHRLLRELYISNHDQDNPKHLGILLEGMENFTLDGNGSNFWMNGRMLPIALLECKNCTLENLSIDSHIPQITQVEILENNPDQKEITYRIADYVHYSIVDQRLVVSDAEDPSQPELGSWHISPTWGIAFDPNTGHLLYQTSEIGVGTQSVEEIAPRTLRAKWHDPRLLPGTQVAMRSYARPTPGILLSECQQTVLRNTTVHYAEGMGLLAQVCEDITLDHFNVALRPGSGRYFTTQADATHFSGCKGLIQSTGGLYESMMDDAINVHGTYLRIKERINDYEIIARYMHPQAYGFYWGGVGDSLHLINSSTMEIVGENTLLSIEPDAKDPQKSFRIRFSQPVPEEIANGSYGIENLEWTPRVYFADNIIRNNRARGALFSTPEEVIIERNFFDHTSGTAILLCGDCNGWFETGACRRVIIRNNRFLNALTNLFQFTNAIISIYPVIPNLAAQQQYFHGGPDGGVWIEDNVFETFDTPLVYAKSLDGLFFRNNTLIHNNDYNPFHWNQEAFLLERVNRVEIIEPTPFQPVESDAYPMDEPGI